MLRIRGVESAGWDTLEETEQLIVTRIAQGVRYTEISEETNTPVPTIKKIRKRNELMLVEIRQQNIKKEATFYLFSTITDNTDC